MNECTYCKTKHARGELGSYNVEEIVERVKQSFAGKREILFHFFLMFFCLIEIRTSCAKIIKFLEGVVEIWLTSEDTGAYGKDIGSSIVELLWKIVEHIPEGCFLRYRIKI